MNHLPNDSQLTLYSLDLIPTLSIKSYLKASISTVTAVVNKPFVHLEAINVSLLDKSSE